MIGDALAYLRGANAVSGSVIATIENAAQTNIAISAAVVRLRRTATNTTATSNQAASPKNESIPTRANSGCKCQRLKPIICGPRVNVHTVFSQPILAARSSANGAQNNHQTFIQSGKFPVRIVAIVVGEGSPTGEISDEVNPSPAGAWKVSDYPPKSRLCRT